MSQFWDIKKYEAFARKAQAEGAVLLKNDRNALPLKKGEKVALFGRTQFNYFKSGTGSGGLVNVDRVIGIYEGLQESGEIEIDANIRAAYEAWIKDHPFDAGHGWATEPWFQEEMIPSEELVHQAAAEDQAAILILGRTAGEDHDNSAAPGSYLLTEDEETLVRMISAAFKRTIVVLNVGNIIDMKWVGTYDPAAVMYVWQGGQVGGSGVADVLLGKNSPCGRLADTIAIDIDDYPSTKNFGDPDRDLYQEDIYVGYRYFETFAKDRVLYPFGFGLSYTDFSQEICGFEYKEGRAFIQVKVTNTGAVAGKDVAQVYVSAPQGKLGKAARVLVDFGKTRELQPGESEVLSFEIEPYTYASYDDAGVTPYPHAYVLEEGEYGFYAGKNVREAELAGTIVLEKIHLIAQLKEAMAPNTAFDRLVPERTAGGGLKKTYRPVPMATEDQRIRRDHGLDDLIAHTKPYTGDKGYRLRDVADGKVSMEDFLAQISDDALIHMMRGEGMCSPKVTPGIAGAFGGVGEELKGFGIPVAGCADGPSGIRMDCGTHAFAMPNGACLACTFDRELIKELYSWEGLELRRNHIDALLGPGMNIHRSPLNGRNFEYFSEDPYLTGEMAAAQLKGMHTYGTTGVIKHFCCNNQEFRRNFVDAAVSERALREIYLKGFEIAVRKGGARAVMTTYGPVNGLWTASNYDLLTTILRGEWGFEGIAMTDWWAKGNDFPGDEGTLFNVAAQVRAQNDLNMVNGNAEENSSKDNLPDALKSGHLTRAELCRSAANICRFLIGGICFLYSEGRTTELDKDLENSFDATDQALRQMIVARFMTPVYDIDPDLIKTQRGDETVFSVQPRQQGVYKVSIDVRAKEGYSPVAQLPMSLFLDAKLIKSLTLTGSDTEWTTIEFIHPAFVGTFFLKFFFGQTGLEIGRVHLEMIETREEAMRHWKQEQEAAEKQ